MELLLRSTNKGYTIIELLVALAIASLMLPALLTGLVSSREGKAQQTQRRQAVSLLNEAEEAVRSYRNRGWDSFAVNGTYHPVVSGQDWTLVSGSESVNGFTRSINVSDVSRDATGKIVTSGGTVDPSTKKIVVTVVWSTPSSSSIQSTLYLTRYQDNLTYTDTTQADFNAGTKSGTTVTNTSGGEVILAAGGGGGDWCAPSLAGTAVDLPNQGVANAVTAIEGRVFAGTGNNSSGVSFANVSIVGDTPPVATTLGTFDGFKTNGVFGETNYAYLATDNHSKEIEIINLTTNPYSEAGYFNAPGNGSGNSIYVKGNVGYMTAANKFYTFDLSSKTGSRSQLGSANLAATGNRVYVVGNYAYVAINSTTTQLQIIDVTNPSSPSIVGQASVNGQAAVDVFVNSSGTRAYIATASSASQRELFIIDVSTKTGNRPTVGSYDTNGMNPKGLTVVTGNRVIIVGTGGEQYQAVDINTESNPNRCGGLTIASGVNGVSSVLQSNGYAYSYIVTGDASSELKIILGGAGNEYTASGNFVSRIFDATKTTAFNRLDLTTTTLAGVTDIKFQVSIVNAVNNNCNQATYSYVGPDNTANTYFTAASNVLQFSSSGSYLNPGRCFRYTAFLTSSDNTQTPVIYDLTVNYSP